MIIAVNFQFKQLERRSLKKSRLQGDSNPFKYKICPTGAKLKVRLDFENKNSIIHFSNEVDINSNKVDIKEL